MATTKNNLKKHYKKILIFFVLLAVIFGLRYSGIGEYLSLDALKENRDMLQTAVADNYLGFASVFILTYIVVVAFSIPGAAVLTLASGFLFGAIVGTAFVNVAATSGALLAFLASRFLLGHWVQTKYENQLKKFNEEIERNGRSYLLTLRFIPIFPFFLINILAGVTKIPIKTFVWTTSLGIIPGSFVYAFAGQQLMTVDSLRDVLSLNIVLAFVLLGLLALIPVIHRKYHRMKEGKKFF